MPAWYDSQNSCGHETFKVVKADTSCTALSHNESSDDKSGKWGKRSEAYHTGFNPGSGRRTSREIVGPWPFFLIPLLTVYEDRRQRTVMRKGSKDANP